MVCIIGGYSYDSDFGPIITRSWHIYSVEFLWNYKDQSAWGKVPGWEVSATGKRQSPIHIETKNLVVNNILTPLKMEVSCSLVLLQL